VPSNARKASSRGSARHATGFANFLNPMPIAG
jgi:hypothetical protein